MNASLSISDDPADIGAMRQQIAAATRMLVMEEILDYSGHVSARMPDGDTFMVQNASDSRGELEPDRLLVMDLDGRVVAGNEKPPLETVLHAEIFRARPDVQAILHCHLELAISFTLMKNVGLVPVRSRAVRWRSGIPTHPDPSLIRRKEQGESLAATLGHHNAALLRSHGMVLVAESVPALYIDALHFKANARAQMSVLQAGQTLVPMTEAEMDMIDSPREFHIAKLWNFYVRKARASRIIPSDWSATL
ncbi:Ribulose-5-phosphate 4-epimerase/Fuculose-1-phosphate aldolase [Roseicitreum antarcticum]|uniref:Ribulose-5-phosphate 4-epimerase/Fuculose-1-phosphate aldolase n=2 Tax=Roseicitreum antarcticum TaxID=564137 RepID=A0A1H2W1B3_9RHOB|nr:Ribulose-5-phosphate 4-epimerase/Fuculose-1-phosphate aldolase [Roseicitreum antarcticum]